MTVVALTAFVTVTDRDGNDPLSFKDFDGKDITKHSASVLTIFKTGKHLAV